MRAARPGRDGGFTYLSLVILLAIIGLVTASALKLGSVLQRSRAEQELLDIGAAFSDALQSYADATPSGLPPQPPSLKELLKDPRFPGTRRHLRKIFVDPMTGKAEWGFVYLGEKTGVVSVYSLSDAKPVKIGNFPSRFAGLEGKGRISDWKFSASGKSALPPDTDMVPKPAATVSITQQNKSETPVPPPAAPQTLPVPPVPPEEPPVPPEAPAPPSPDEPDNVPQKQDST